MSLIRDTIQLVSCTFIKSNVYCERVCAEFGQYIYAKGSLNCSRYGG